MRFGGRGDPICSSIQKERGWCLGRDVWKGTHLLIHSKGERLVLRKRGLGGEGETFAHPSERREVGA